MNLFGPIGFSLGLIVPILALGVLAIILPRFLFSKMPPTLVSVGINLALSSVILVLFAAVLFSALYVFQGADVASVLAAAPGLAIVQFLKLGVSSALIWAPVLFLVLFGLAQRTVS